MKFGSFSRLWVGVKTDPVAMTIRSATALWLVTALLPIPEAVALTLDQGAGSPPASTDTGAGGAAAPATTALPKILRSDADLPEAVRATRRALVDAARSGDMERLRALMKAQPKPPAVAIGNAGDPIDYLKALSTDAGGREMLAVLLKVLEMGFVRVSAGTPDELYVWPYFAQYPLEALTPPQIVELFTLVTAADFEDMRSYGAYTFFRVGIAPDGRWLFFLAGG